MSYHSRIREIQSAFVMGFEDRETCINLFEGLLHEYGLLFPGDQLDRSITDEGFITLLKAAKDHRGIDLPPEDDPKKQDDLAKAELMRRLQDSNLPENLRRLLQPAGEPPQGADGPQYRIAEQRCPVCQKPISALYNRVQSANQQVVPVEPPRCQECMAKWIEERYGTPAVKPEPADTLASPMSLSEAAFFEEYERQMSE